MNMLQTRWLISGIVVLAIVGTAGGQETTPAGSEKAYLDLRKSEDRVTQLTAERYFNLVRQQEWTSADGKQKVLAKYVAHDPNFKWVKLATSRGAGKDRVIREVTVQVAKLNKACQSRVQRIALLQPKLDELIAAGPEMGAAGTEDAGNEYGRGRGRSMRGERGGYSGYGGYDSPASDSSGEEVPTTDAPTDERAAAAGAADVATGADDPDPLGFGELANEPPLEMPAGLGAVPLGAGGASDAAYSRYNSAGEQAPAGAADRSQWAASYDAFLANLTATNEGGVATVDWGDLGDLRAMNDAAVEHARDSSADPYRSNIGQIAERIGEVHWQGGFAGVEAQASGGPEVRFNLPPLPEPLKIRFLADESEASIFSGMQRGQQVQFSGRFDIKAPNEIDVYIRVAN